MPQKAYFDQQVLKTCIIEGIDTFGLYVLVHSLVFLIAILSLDKGPDKNDIYYLFLPNIDREATLPYAWVRSNAAYKNVLWWSSSWEA